MAGASFTSAGWEYRPNYFAVWTGLPGCEWEYYRLNRPGGKPGLIYPARPLRNSYNGPRRYAIGIWMHGNGACFILTPQQLARGQCVSSPLSTVDILAYIESIKSTMEEYTPTMQIDLGSANLATKSLNDAIERLKLQYPVLA